MCCVAHFAEALEKKLIEFQRAGVHPGDVAGILWDESPELWRKIIDNVAGELAQGTPCAAHWKWEPANA